jgi:acyl carrier protein
MRKDDPRIEDIIAVVAGETGVDPKLIDAAKPVADLGISSLDLIETIFKLESRFGIEIPNDGPLNNTGVTVGTLIDEVLALLDRAAGGNSQAKPAA